MSLVHSGPVELSWTVNEVLRTCPDSIVVLNRYGIDACCGGADTLAEAAEREGVDAAVLLDELRQAAASR